jgi:hypothetical protein
VTPYPAGKLSVGDAIDLSDRSDIRRPPPLLHGLVDTAASFLEWSRRVYGVLDLLSGAVHRLTGALCRPLLLTGAQPSHCEDGRCHEGRAENKAHRGVLGCEGTQRLSTTQGCKTDHKRPEATIRWSATPKTTRPRALRPGASHTQCRGHHGRGRPYCPDPTPAAYSATIPKQPGCSHNVPWGKIGMTFLRIRDWLWRTLKRENGGGKR